MAKRSVAPNQNKVSEARALYFTFATAGVTLLLSGLFFYNQTIQLFGSPSIGTTASVIAMLAAIVAFYIVEFMRDATKDERTTRGVLRRIVWTGSLAFVHAAVGFLLTTGIFFILHDAFIGLSFDWMTASVMTAGYVAALGYIFYLSATAMNTLRLSAILAIFIISGALTSMITAQDPYWWQLHFSSLGADGTFSSVAFNLTLIVGGLVIMSLADYISNDFGKLQSADKRYVVVNRRLIRTLLTLMGLFLAFVGIFKYDDHVWLHNSSAGAMAFIFAVLVVLMPRIAPVFARAFTIFSYALLGGLLFSFWLFNGRFHYLNLTAFELIAFGVVFTWLIVFIRQIAASLQDRKA